MQKLDIEKIWEALGATTDDQQMLVSTLVHSIYYDPANNTGARGMDRTEYRKAIFGDYVWSRPIDIEVYILAVSWANDFEDIAKRNLPWATGSIFKTLFSLLNETYITEGVMFKM